LLGFLSALIEEFADEWGNKWMMHFRWYSSRSAPDAANYSRRIAVELKSGAAPGTPGLQEDLDAMASGFASRMLDRGFTVGSSDVTAPIIEKSYVDALTILERHLQHRPYLFGSRPSIGDFGLAGQLYQCFQDVTAGELMRLHAPHVALWAERMVNPSAVGEGNFESWGALSATLLPFLQSQVRIFLTWSEAIAAALAARQSEMTVVLDGVSWHQTVAGPQKYHAKSLKEIRKKCSDALSNPTAAGALAEALRASGCFEYLVTNSKSRL